MPDVDTVDLAPRVDEILNRWPAVGLAVGVVRNGSLASFHGRGVADITSGTPITEDTVFPIGSITKTFTAIAVMQLWEQGLVDLDAPANDHLRAFTLVPGEPTWRPATVRHLLTHTAGVPEFVHPSRMVRSGWFGESVALDEPRPALADYYRGGLRLGAEPGTTFTYTDHGPAVLGQLVEDVTGVPLDRYLREHVFEPLGMGDSDLLRTDRLASRRATGYRLRSGGPEAVTDRVWVTVAAAAIHSTPRDMARYLAALLRGGSGELGRILAPETLAMMFAPQYQPDHRLPGMGLGFWRVDLGGHAAVEHQGIVPGFNSQIFVAHDDGVGVVAFTNGARNAVRWLAPEVAQLLRGLIGVPADGIRTDLPQRADRWRELCGSYRTRAQWTDIMAWSVLGAGVDVVVRRGQLVLRTFSPIPELFRGVVLHPDHEADPDVFRVDLSRSGLGTSRVVFGREPGGGVTSLHFEMPPLSLDRRTGGGSPRQWVSGAVGGLAVATAITAVRRRGGARAAGRRT